MNQYEQGITIVLRPEDGEALAAQALDRLHRQQAQSV